MDEQPASPVRGIGSQLLCRSRRDRSSASPMPRKSPFKTWSCELRSFLVDCQSSELVAPGVHAEAMLHGTETGPLEMQPDDSDELAAKYNEPGLMRRPAISPAHVNSCSWKICGRSVQDQMAIHYIWLAIGSGLDEVGSSGGNLGRSSRISTPSQLDTFGRHLLRTLPAVINRYSHIWTLILNLESSTADQLPSTANIDPGSREASAKPVFLPLAAPSPPWRAGELS